jgi:hypothetical protein
MCAKILAIEHDQVRQRLAQLGNTGTVLQLDQRADGAWSFVPRATRSFNICSSGDPRNVSKVSTVGSPSIRPQNLAKASPRKPSSAGAV